MGEFADGTRLKFKLEQFLVLHKLKANISFKNVLQAMQDKTLDFFLDNLPDEFRREVLDYKQQINRETEQLCQVVEQTFADLPSQGTRKDFALRVLREHKHLAPHLFWRLDHPAECLRDFVLEHHFLK